MAKMLDLSVFQEQFFTIKLLDGSEVNLKKPSQKLLMEMVGFEKIRQESPEAQLYAINNVVLHVLNNNREGKVFKAEDIAEYDLVIQQAIIQGYADFLNEVMKNPN